MANKRFVFAVQGEGRGHLTQALTLFKTLHEQGHTVCCVIVGRNPDKEIPDFFLKRINVPVIQVESPNLNMNKSGTSVNISRTLVKTFTRWKIYNQNLAQIKQIMDQFNPHIVINFYEPLISLYVLKYPRSFRIISIAHQYIYLHKKFKFPHGFPIQAWMLKWYSRFTAIGSDKIMALSMYELPVLNYTRLVITPPALRKELFQQRPEKGDFILVYLMSSGFMKDIINWHKKNPSTKLICFTDSRDVKERHKGLFKMDETLSFYSLNDEKFLDLMASCSALVCTAGFESVCEAIYLGKPVILVPIKGHFEQYCNAWDAERIGAGLFAEKFDLDLLGKKLLLPQASTSHYIRWVNSFTSSLNLAIDHLEDAPKIKLRSFFPQ
jgi:uncharacterized protein (TIGR00661 family)